MTQEQIDNYLARLKEGHRKIWITRTEIGDGNVRMTINGGEAHVVTREFGAEMFRKYVFNPNDKITL